jgi:uncharacterized delta-60 repeat protein
VSAQPDRRRRVIAAAAVAALLAVPTAARAAAGDPDGAFSGDGRFELAPGGGFVARGVAIQPDGRIVVAGYSCVPGASGDGTCAADGQSSFRLVRLTAGGDLDPTFGQGGMVTTPVGSIRSQAFDVLVAPDGRIVAGGAARNDAGRDVLALARYDASGRLDRSFDGDGVALHQVGSGFTAIAALAAGPSGSIIAAGQAADAQGRGRMAVARVRADGALDQTFGTGGSVIAGSPSGFVLGVESAPDGGLLAAGVAEPAPDSGQDRVGLLRLDARGRPLATFSGDGWADEAAGGTPSFANAVAMWPGEAWLVAGAAVQPSGHQAMTLLRERADGTPDPGWGSAGVAVLRLGGGSVAADGIALADGRAIAVGHAADGGMYSFASARLTATGALDTTYGQAGWAVASWDRYPIARATAAALDADGRLVAAGLGCDGGAGAQCDKGTSILLVTRTLGGPPAAAPPPAPPPAAEADRRAPRGRLRGLPRSIRRAVLARRGLRVRIQVDEDASVDLTLRARRRPGRRTVVVAHAAIPSGAGPFRVRLTPGRRVRSRRISGPLRLVAVLRDPAGNRSVLRARIRLR